MQFVPIQAFTNAFVGSLIGLAQNGFFGRKAGLSKGLFRVRENLASNGANVPVNNC
jgi:hypothetical protein